MVTVREKKKEGSDLKGFVTIMNDLAAKIDPQANAIRPVQLLKA